MNHPGHEIVKCRTCGDVIQQCRCMMRDKPVRFHICDTCKAQEIPPPPPPKDSTTINVAAAELFIHAFERWRTHARACGQPACHDCARLWATVGKAHDVAFASLLANGEDTTHTHADSGEPSSPSLHPEAQA